MDGRGWIARHGFWPVALLWLPAGVVAQAALVSLGVTVPCGLPLALGCRRLRRLGYRRGAWSAGIVLGAATVWAAVVAGLLGLPVWIAWLWLARLG